ncbi:MAG: hypothetical protein IJE51_02120 [Clostridia bacterium]|nr:hypothetical protein [Clostridia bacterium]
MTIGQLILKLKQTIKKAGGKDTDFQVNDLYRNENNDFLTHIETAAERAKFFRIQQKNILLKP